MLNCTDVACILHHHEEHMLAAHLQDHRAHHEHQVYGTCMIFFVLFLGSILSALNISVRRSIK